MTVSDTPKVRLGRISFINVDPIYYGFEHQNISEDVQITSAPPSELNRMLASDMLDISSVSSAAYGIHHRKWLLLPGVSIACNGNVMSVLLVSRTPLESLHGKKVQASDESATAVRLMQLLFAHRNITPILETRKIHMPSQVSPDAAAALVIGDAALHHDWSSEFEYVWDLGDLWARHANLPFVFAVWAVREEFAAAHPRRVSKIIELLESSKQMGFSNLDSVVASAAARLDIDPRIILRYFKNFCFDFNAPERSGLKAFFNDLSTTGIFPDKVSIRFFDSY